jgi:hypothetical protein
MPEIIYRCYFEKWEDFMDGDLTVDGEMRVYDFVSKEQWEDEGKPEGIPVLEPFTEDEARKHFAAQGYPDVKFIYE